MLLGAGVLAVIGNTIRLEIQGRRTEIEVIQLVGGSSGFVRRPFLYTGMLYGLWGALLAWAMVEVAVLVLRSPVATLARLYGSGFTLSGPGLPEAGLIFGAGLGWAGSAPGSRPPVISRALSRERSSTKLLFLLFITARTKLNSGRS